MGGVHGAVAVHEHDQAVPGAAVLGGGQYAVQGVAAVPDRDPLLRHGVRVLPQDHPGESGGHDQCRDERDDDGPPTASRGTGLRAHGIGPPLFGSVCFRAADENYRFRHDRLASDSFGA
ncbi:hypothetical protein GCM10018773_26930 [Streptomyces candidus]|nr:hypothetical protein GCM10018773_26930 [Streptomyces candidus]